MWRCLGIASGYTSQPNGEKMHKGKENEKEKEI
jgi:hypothetical protein